MFCGKSERSGEGSRPPSVSGGIQLSTLPVGPERSPRLFGLAPVGSRRFTRSRTNVIDGRIILGPGCVVSAPLPWLSPAHSRGPPSRGGGTFLSWAFALPSAALPLLTIQSKNAVIYNRDVPVRVLTASQPSLVSRRDISKSRPMLFRNVDRCLLRGRGDRPARDPMPSGRGRKGVVGRSERELSGKIVMPGNRRYPGSGSGP